ncbi:hypothetical protein RhiXN_07750 [Rhizoctonia solani]|uniref:Uncharacterized protein n=1 Tax=Rhizoctonia solani TaxID=456999 RepID=A0A8H8NZB4_9AGAM|nr:uncharacterized protein RhiXN_07750 [Rhizoctonia solani]QRW22714.1 hypothetical protein RhiXN_07750 [Rhizoctonia solani]
MTDTHTRPRATPEGPTTAAQGSAHPTAQSTADGTTPAANHTTAAAESAASSDSTCGFFRTIAPLPAEDAHEDLGSAVDSGTNLDDALGNPTITEANSVTIPNSSTSTRPDHPPPQQHHLPPDSGFRRTGPSVEHGRIPRSHCAIVRPLVDAFGEISYHIRSESGDPSKSGVKHRTVRCGLEDIAHATHLRPDDIALALRESGLLTRRRSTQSNPAEPAGPGTEHSENNTHTIENISSGAQDPKRKNEAQIVITHEMVEKVAQERKVKPPYLDRAYVLL